MILGSVDAVNTDGVVGWVHSSTATDTLKVQATINNRVIGHAVANLFRPDLAEANLGTGHCGFEIRFENPIDITYLPFVETRLAGGTLVLPRTSTAGFSDYFSEIYKRYPQVGRYSSILGGLWTDRSDATALLKARTDIGRISPGDSGALSRFISEGLVEITLEADQESANQRAPLTKDATSAGKKNPLRVVANGSTGAIADWPAAISRIFFDDRVLRLLRAILEDNPIAVSATELTTGETDYSQFSGLEDWPSPTECLGLVAALGESVSIEVLRGSHRFPEFSADGVSRWTFGGRPRVAATSVAPNVHADIFTLSRPSVAIVGPGLIQRVRASASNPAIRILAIPAYQGSVRFRQQIPAGELSDRSGARIWLAGSPEE